VGYGEMISRQTISMVYFGYLNQFAMPHSFNKIWIHGVWSTKERFPFLQSSIEQKVYDYISAQFDESGYSALRRL